MNRKHKDKVELQQLPQESIPTSAFDDDDIECYDVRQLDQEVPLDSNLPRGPPSLKFRGARYRAQKWGKIIMVVGYALIVMNGLALIMTTLKVTKIIDERAMNKQENPYSKELHDTSKHFTEEERGLILEEAAMKDRDIKYHDVIMNRSQETWDNWSKIVDELLQITMGVLMVKATQDCMANINRELSGL